MWAHTASIRRVLRPSKTRRLMDHRLTHAAQPVGSGPCPSCALNSVTVNTAGNVFLRVPNLGIGPTAGRLQTASNYKYNSLQVTLRKQLSKGLQLQAAYSWNRGFEQVEQGTNTYPYIVQAYAPEYFVRPQRLVVNYVWELPLGKRTGATPSTTRSLRIWMEAMSKTW